MFFCIPEALKIILVEITDMLITAGSEGGGFSGVQALGGCQAVFFPSILGGGRDQKPTLSLGAGNPSEASAEKAETHF